MASRNEPEEKAPDARVVRTQNDVLRAATDVLIEEGWDAVTQPHVARAAGYSKATVYAHWPERIDLLRDALGRFSATPHSYPTGDLRSDVLRELGAYRYAIREHRLDRVMVTLADKAMTNPEVVEIRDTFVADGERIIRSILGPYLEGKELDGALAILSGALLHRVLFFGVIPDDEELEAITDLVLTGTGLQDRDGNTTAKASPR